MKLFYATVFLFLSSISMTAQSWEQTGSTLYGPQPDQSFGRSVSLSGDGTRAAISTGGNFSAQRVKIYQLANNMWTQLGSDIPYGSNQVCKISKDGNSVIIGHPGDNSSPSSSFNWFGSARVYSWDGTAWIQKGATLYAWNYGYFGYSVGISEDGSRISIYSMYGSNYVMSFEWNTTQQAWVQRGSVVSVGNNSASITHGAMDMSADGNTFIVAAPGSNNGKVGIYSWSGTNWQAKGSIFNGNATEYLGWNVSINGNGNVILIGSPMNDNAGNNTGEFRLYQWSGTAWTQKGQTFNGTLVTSFECCVAIFASSLDSSGDNFAYYVRTAELPNAVGVVRAMSYDNGQWIQKGTDIDGQAGDNTWVNFMSLSGDGKKIAIGFPYDFTFNDGSSTGRVKLYHWDTGLSVAQHNGLSPVSVYPNPVNDRLYFQSEAQLLTMEVYDVTGRKVKSVPVTQSSIDLSDLQTGNYLVKGATENGAFTHKIIKQ